MHARVLVFAVLYNELASHLICTLEELRPRMDTQLVAMAALEARGVLCLESRSPSLHASAIVYDTTPTSDSAIDVLVPSAVPELVLPDLVESAMMHTVTASDAVPPLHSEMLDVVVPTVLAPVELEAALALGLHAFNTKSAFVLSMPAAELPFPVFTNVRSICSQLAVFIDTDDGTSKIGSVNIAWTTDVMLQLCYRLTGASAGFLSVMFQHADAVSDHGIHGTMLCL